MDAIKLDHVKYFFIGAAIVELCVEFFNWRELRHLSKPLLMPILLVYFRKGTTGPLSLSFILAVFALVFSFVGDSFLMYSDRSEVYFLLGLGAFAVVQILYALSFSKAVYQSSPSQPIIQKVLYAVPFVFVGFSILFMVWDGIGSLKIPVILYASILIVMCLMAVYRNGRANVDSVNQVILGAIFFILSDALLAIDKFRSPMENGGLFIMITYLLAQWNIINGLQKHYNQAK